MKRIMTAALAALMLLGGCGKNEEAPIRNIGVPSQSDSLIYYYGLSCAADYWREAATDTAMKSDAEIKRYLKGLKDGLDAVDESNDTYNRGLQAGIAMALSLYQYNSEFDVHINRSLLYDAMKYGLKNDSIVNGSEARAIFRELYSRVTAEKNARAKARAKINLKQEAEKLKMNKVNDDLYLDIEKKGNGAEVKEGDLIYVSMDYKREDGVDLGMPSPGMLRVGGPGMSEVMTDAFTHMRQGETAKLATNASSLFGSKASSIGLEPENVVFVTITINKVESPDTTTNIAR